MHKKDGFTIIEVMIALLIIAVIIVPVWALQGTIVASVTQFRDRLSCIWFAKQLLYQARRKQAPVDTQFSLKNQSPFPAIDATYDLKPVAKNSSVGNQYRLFLEKSTAQRNNKQAQEVIISFIYKPEQGA